ncbi:unnamed protein product [Musa acuminata var. zebrina]
MGSSQTMDSAFHLFLLPNASALPSIAAVIVFAISVLWLYPGGLAWALSRADRSIPRPPGHGPPPLRFRRAPCPRQARRVAQSLRLDGLLPRLHTLRLVKPPRHSPGDPQQLGVRRSPCPYELLFHRRVLAQSQEDHRHLSVQSDEKHRKVIGQQMIHDVMASTETNGIVGIKKVLHYGSLNNVMISDFGKVEVMELERPVTEGYELLGAFNWSDHFPPLA